MKKIKSLTELKEGDMVLVKNPLREITIGDQKITFEEKYDVAFLLSFGNKEKFNFISEMGASLHLRADEAEEWEIQLIDEKHPRYNVALATHGRTLNAQFKIMAQGLQP